METIEKKQEYEKSLTIWINESGERIKKYGELLPEYKELYNQVKAHISLSTVIQTRSFSTAEWRQ